jgi:hypothetical protein
MPFRHRPTRWFSLAHLLTGLGAGARHVAGRTAFAVAAAGPSAVLLIAARAPTPPDGRGVPMSHTTFTWPGDAAERTPLSPAC